ncbi:hypothetical protein [Streptomyces carpaticus]|uniref:hypothetical protein n=1 Tax=Streptomyces carpaticus TaxID=285558 RepID=UPI0031F7E7BA
MSQTPRPARPGLKKLAIVLWSVLGVVLVVAAIGAIVGGDEEQEPAAAEQELTDEQLAEAQERAGIPPEPDAETAAAYVAALEAIDPDIVHGKAEKVIDRGRSQCQTIGSYPDDREHQVAQADVRFSSPDHPEGFGPEVAEQILDITHEHICPTY